MRKNKIALVGCGRWGENYLKHLNGEIVAIVDPDKRIEDPRRVDTIGDLEYTSIDGAIIASPASMHWEHAIEFLGRCVPCLVEKPLTTSLTSAKRMIEVAQKHSATIHAGHIFSCYEMPDMEDISLMTACWAHQGRKRRDCSVWWDMAPHAIYLMMRIAGYRPWKVRLSRNLELDFGDFHGRITCSWNSPRRRFVAVMNRMGYESRVEFDEIALQPTPLERQIDAWNNGQSNLQEAVDVVAILEAATGEEWKSPDYVDVPSTILQS